MAHITPDFNTKKAFKEAITSGKQITVTSLRPTLTEKIEDGIAYIEAPATYHKWYAKVRIEKGIITKVLG
jgi:predicted aldo/keto reductase-like oxidoreductase